MGAPVAWQPAVRLDACNGITPVRIGTRALLVVRAGDDVSVVDALCPHKFGPLAEGCLEDGRLVCPLHDAHFDPATGAPRPGDEWAGRLTVLPSRVEGGVVQVEI